MGKCFGWYRQTRDTFWTQTRLPKPFSQTATMQASLFVLAVICSGAVAETLHVDLDGTSTTFCQYTGGFMHLNHDSWSTLDSLWYISHNTTTHTTVLSNPNGAIATFSKLFSTSSMPNQLGGVTGTNSADAFFLGYAQSVDQLIITVNGTAGFTSCTAPHVDNTTIFSYSEISCTQTSQS
jgi:hypothetical protein